LATEKGWPVYYIKVKSTFLNENLKEEVYVEHPSSFVIPNFKNKVC